MNIFRKGIYGFSIVLAIIIFISFSKNIYAQTVVSQPVISTSTANGFATGFQTFGSSTPSAISNLVGESFDTVQVNISTNDPSMTAIVQQCSSSDFCENFVSSTISISSSDFDGGFGGFKNFLWQTFPFSFSTLSSTTAHYYKLLIQRNTVGKFFEFSGSINPNSYVNGFGGASPVKDIGFYIGLGSGAGNFISINFPSEGLVTPAFSNWVVDYSISPLLSLNEVCLQVNYGTSSSNLFYRDGCGYAAFNGHATSSNILVDHFFSIDDWFAQAYIKVGNVNYATSSIRSFSVTSIGNPFDNQPTFPAGYATSTGTLKQQCEQNGFFEAWMCNFFNLFFTPHESSKDFIYEQIALIKKVFPFNVFFGISDLLATRFVDYQGSAGLTLMLPFINNTQITFFSPDMISDAFGTTTAEAVEVIEEYIIWILVGMVIIVTVI